MSQATVEQLFQILDTTALLLKKEFQYTYFDGLMETGENILAGEVQQPISYSSTKERLQQEYDKLEAYTFEKDTMRRAFQLGLLKGMKEGIQPNHEMTPDTVALFVSYLVNQFTKGQEMIDVLDLAVGTGNLLTAVLNHSDKKMKASGVEVDELLIRLGMVNSNLQQNEVELFNQDALAPLLVNPADVVLCDMPVGYYPNREGAKEFTLNRGEEMAFAHHLFIEQGLRYTKDGGYLFFIIPNSLFQGEGAKELHAFIHEHAYIQGLLQLPLSMFKNDRYAKSIFVLQKKGNGAHAPKEVMLVELPSFKNAQGMDHVLRQLEEWFKTKK
ncbi:MAG: class I SAM-dependent methyltransferase [Bacillaceae bacterium]